MDAIAVLLPLFNGRAKHFYVIEGDLQSYFDTVHHRKLLSLLKRRLADRDLLTLIWKFLKAGVMHQGLFARTDAGVPQGGVISPLLANVYLHEFDRWAEAKWAVDRRTRQRTRYAGRGNYTMVRYADDFVVVSNDTRAGVDQTTQEIAAFLVVGIVVAALTSVIGLAIGLVSGYVRRLDGIVMRVMDGVMALPDLLLAISFVALTGASVRNVILALIIPQTPRVVRLVRGVVLSLREQPFVEASVAMGAGLPRISLRHILPNTVAPLIVQGTYVCASAVLIEAGLSFLGAGTPPESPSWGNIMAEARSYVRVAFWLLLFPGGFLALTVLSINLLGDGLRDLLDPRMARRA
jgi:ABC-type antimicrobial peptide transport system permease subunit